MKKININSEFTLRQKAEGLLNNKTTKEISQIAEADSLKLIHELEVYQIELDMQNEELIPARESAQRYAKRYITLYDFAPSGYYTLSEEGNILELNLCGAKYLSKNCTELINRKFDYFISPKSKPFFQLFLYKIFLDKKSETCEIILANKDGEVIYLQLTGIISDIDTTCFLTAVDITKRIEAEEKLLLKNSIFDSSIASNCFTDLQGIIIEVNNSFYLMHGYKAKYEVVGKCIYDLVAFNSEKEKIKKSLSEYTQWEGEFSGFHANGSTIIVQGSISIVRDKYGRKIGFQSSTIDITEKRKIQNDLSRPTGYVTD